MMEQARLVASDDGDQAIIRCVDDIRQRLSAALRAVNEIVTAPVSLAVSQPLTEADVRMLLKFRRNRDRFFAMEIFADPAWDILLELYAAELGQQRISVSSACIGAAVPATTALRWIKTLEENRLVQRKGDPFDGRRIFLSLTDVGLTAMNAYFRTVPPGLVLV